MVLERFSVGVIDAEAVHHPGALAVDVFVGDHLGGGAFPIGASLDAEQVMAVAAVAGGNFPASPAGFQGRLGKDQRRRHAGTPGRFPGRLRQLVHEIRGRGRVGGAQQRRPGPLGARQGGGCAGIVHRGGIAFGSACRSFHAGQAARLAARNGVQRRRAAGGPGGVRGSALTGKLRHQLVRQAQTATGHVLRHLLIEQRLIKTHLRAVGELRTRRGVAHALDHAVQEQRLELLGGAAQLLLRVAGGAVLEPVEALHVQRELTLYGTVQTGHQIISSSARRAPEAFSASRIDISSWGVAPSALRASTTSIRSAPSTNCSEPCCC